MKPAVASSPRSRSPSDSSHSARSPFPARVGPVPRSMTSFVALLHIPHVVDAPHDRFEVTSLAVAWTVTSAVWVVAASQWSRGRHR